MAQAVLVVFSRPSSPSKEAEYNEWYDEVHLTDMLKCKGFVAGSRYKLSSAQTLPDASGQPEYMAVYDLETDNLEESVRSITEAGERGAIRTSDALQMDPYPASFIYELITPRREA